MKCFVCDTELEYQNMIDEHMSIGCPRCGKMWYDESLPNHPDWWRPPKGRKIFRTVDIEKGTVVEEER